MPPVLSQEHRLTSSEAFGETVRAGTRAGSATMVLHLLPPSGASAPTPARVGFVVSKGVGTAVTRNRVKRRLRHLVRPRLSALPAGSRLVVRALAPAAAASSADLAVDLDRCLRRVSR